MSEHCWLQAMSDLSSQSEAGKYGIQSDKDLTTFNTLGFAAEAAFFAEVESVDSCRQLLAYARRQGWLVYVLGGGSNLVLQGRLPGLTLRMVNRTLEYKELGGHRVQVRVGAGMLWHDLVMATAEAELAGLENLALIPGCAGAAPVQNIGAYGVELADTLVSVEAVRVADNTPVIFSAAQCCLSYRDSIFKRPEYGVGGDQQVVITHLTLELTRNGPLTLEYGELKSLYRQEVTPLRVAEAVSDIRRSKLPDPTQLGNAGSFFKNPVVSQSIADRLRCHHPDMPCYPAEPGYSKLAAGWLIDRCGFRGMRTGPVGVYPNQALVLVHYGGGNAGMLLDLAEQICRKVQDVFGICLEREPVVFKGDTL